MDALAFSELATPDFGLFGFGEDRAPFRRTTHEYRVAYTHPYPPTPGFTHDFESPSPSAGVIDVDEEPGPSTSASGPSSPSKNNENFNTLVCARCLDPLVLGGSNLSEDERSRRRLWGLRCGHMLDGKCIDELMKPRPAPDLELTGTDVAAIEPPSNGLQGQSSSTQSPGGTQSVVPGEATPLDGKPASRSTKARGKARAIEPPSRSSQPAEVTNDQAPLTENNSIRSRLRPRNNTGHVGHIFSSSPTRLSFHSLHHNVPQPLAIVRLSPTPTTIPRDELRARVNKKQWSRLSWNGMNGAALLPIASACIKASIWNLGVGLWTKPKG
jgi:hypothetical protein